MNTTDHQTDIVRKLVKTFQITAVTALLGATSLTLRAEAPLYWNPSGITTGVDVTTGIGLGGSGSWDQVSDFWFDGADILTWANDADGVFEGANGTVTLTGGITAADVYFTNALGEYIITNATGAEILTVNATIDTGGGEHIISTPIANSTALTKSGGGRLHLTTDSSATLTGNVQVNGGIISVENNNALGNNSSGIAMTTVASGAALEVNGGSAGLSQVLEPITLNGTGISNNGAIRNVAGYNYWYGTTTLGASGTQIEADSGTLDFYGGINGSGNCNVTISGAGFTRVDAGGLHLGAGTVTVNGPGWFSVAQSSLYSTVLSNVVVNGDAYNVSSDANLGTAPTSLLTNQILLNGGGLASSGTVGMNTNRGISVTTNGGFITINSGSLIPWNLYSQNADVTCNVGTATVYATLHPLWSNSTGVWNLGTGRIIKNGSGDLSTIEGTFTFSNLVVNGGSFSTSLNDAGFGAKPNAFNPSNIVLNGGSIHYRHAWTMTANRGIYLGSNGGELQDQASGDALTIPGAISGPGTLYIGLGTLTCALTLSGANTYTGGTMITNGTVVFIGTNNASGTLGTGNVTNNSSLFINRTDSAFTYGGVLSGTGTLTQMGSGTTTLTGNNTYSGATAITNGTLLVNNTAGSGTGTGSVTVSGKGSLGGTGAIAGSVAVNSGGTLALGGGTLALNGGLTLASGSTVSVQVNKALSQTSGMAAVTGTLINTGADTLVVTNLGPALLAGDTFQIFSSALSGGNTMAVTGGVGVTWSNNLAGNGTITVLRAPALPQPVINQVSLSGGNIIMSGTNGSTGINYCVLTSTNISLSSSNWIAIATNTFGGNAFSITNAMSSGAQQQFYILQLP